MSRVGFEPTIQVFERVKTVHALDRAATVIGAGFCITHETFSEYECFFLSHFTTVGIVSL
jgi:hypothetical protein